MTSTSGPEPEHNTAGQPVFVRGRLPLLLIVTPSQRTVLQCCVYRSHAHAVVGEWGVGGDMNACVLRDSSPRPMMNTPHIQTDSATLITDVIFISLFAVSSNGLPQLSLVRPPSSALFWRACACIHALYGVCVCVCISPYDYPLYAVGRSGIERRPG